MQLMTSRPLRYRNDAGAHSYVQWCRVAATMTAMETGCLVFGDGATEEGYFTNHDPPL